MLFTAVAAIYAAAGSGGGSGYLALMGLAGLPSAAMKPTALSLNILVTSISTWRYVRAGHFSGRLFWPIALAALPLSFLGGRLSLPETIYRPFVGVILLYAAWRLWRGRQGPADGAPVAPPSIWVRLTLGGTIGLLSGILGIGGGIFLAPLLVLRGWADARTTVAVTSAFVLLTSAAGLLGRLSAVTALPPALGLWLGAVAVGSWLGAYLASTRLQPARLRQLIGVILFVGGVRLLLPA